MGKKSRGHSELEELRGLVRKLEAENRLLKKQLSRADKEVKKAFETFTTFIDDVEPIVEQPTTSFESKCPKCSKKIKGIELGARILYSCTNEDCRFRKTIKK